MRNIRKALLTASAMSGLAIASPGQAQAQASPSVEEDAPSGEILVTARRREERLTDVPVSVSVLAGDTLTTKGVERVDDLQIATPSMKTTPTSGRRSNSQYELRGINAIDSLITVDPAVGIYVDEVYRARATGTNQSFFDIANVQVLYGPQGTLFGRNSTGGAILISSNRPTDRLEGSIEAGYGSLDQYRITGMINLPLSESLQLRLAGERVKADGYVRNASTGKLLGNKNSWAGRLSLNFEPSSTFSNLLVVSGYKADEDGTPVVLYGFRSSTTPNQFGQVPALAGTALVTPIQLTLQAERAANFRTTYLTAPNATVPLPGGGGIPLVGATGYRLNGTTLLGTDSFERPRNISVSNTTTYEISDTLTLKNIFGYNYTKLEASTDLDGTPIALIDTYLLTENNQFSNELQLQGTTDRFNFVVGGYYFRESGYDFQPSVQFVALFSSSRLDGVNRSVGIFAQGTYKLTEQLSLTAGARYTWDKRTAEFSQLLLRPLGATFAINNGFGVDLAVGAVCGLSPTLANNGPCSHKGEKSYSEPSYTVSIDYKPSDDVILYLAHRHGYRSGGFNPRLSLTSPASVQQAQIAPYRPETVDDIELGVKGNFDLGGVRARLNVAVYQAWYDDIQKNTIQFIGGTGATVVQNSGSARVRGFEANFGLTPVRGFDLDVFVGYVDGEYDDFPAPNNTLVDNLPFATSRTSLGVNAVVTPMDSDNGKITLIGNYSYRSSYFGDQSLPTLDPESLVPAQHNINLSLNWDRIGGSGFSASGWVRNLTDEQRIIGVTNLAPSFGIVAGFIGEPRTYGFTLKYAFGND